MIQKTWSLKEENFFGVYMSVLLKTKKEGATRRLSPACSLRKFLQNDHWFQYTSF